MVLFVTLFLSTTLRVVGISPYQMLFWSCMNFFVCYLKMKKLHYQFNFVPDLNEKIYFAFTLLLYHIKLFSKFYHININVTLKTSYPWIGVLLNHDPIYILLSESATLRIKSMIYIVYIYICVWQLRTYVRTMWN